MEDLQKAYEPNIVDDKWYSFWENENIFQADPESTKEKFCIVLPPPNVTGSLHMGHAFQQAVSDVLARWKRMKGFNVLWLPGTDHAGIATQTVVEQHLIKTEGKKRTEYSREDFLKHVWAWKEEKQGTILNQMRKMGSSLDWSRLCFTLDEGPCKSVRSMFKKLFDKGLIYQGDYLVNWDVVTQTALADDEVEYEDKDTFLWHFKYPLEEDSTTQLVVATTRPETVLGDTALAVSPEDKRYKHLVGKKVLHPITNELIPIIADSFVDPEFGTGVVKITPAHDPNDYQMGFRHKLPFVNMMTPEGNVNEIGGKYAGLSMEDARKAIVLDFEAKGCFLKKAPYSHRVGVSYRSKAIIQPYISKQWFIKMEPFAKRLRALVESDTVKIVPKTWKNTYYHWIDNLRDWCISRQLWWGHRIPIWYNVDNPDEMLCHDGETPPKEVVENPDKWRQDNDVLDTWFSSALWPFSTLGWPDKTKDLESFFPNSVMITGHDLLFFWVARMIMMSDFVFDKPPFSEVFFNGIIFGKSYWRKREDGSVAYLSAKESYPYEMGTKKVPKDVLSQWEKMSKSKGNVIDPLELISEYGTDALRMALCASSSLLPQIDLDRRRFLDYKNFTNKFWNAARFVFMNLKGDAENNLAPLLKEDLNSGIDQNLFSIEDKWILTVFNETAKEVNKRLESYQFDQATTLAYNFFWKDFCSYYVEISKPYLFNKKGSSAERKNKQKLLAVLLCLSCRLMHPMAPFITEELFHSLKKAYEGISLNTDCPYIGDLSKALNKKSCSLSSFPEPINELKDATKVKDAFAFLERVIYSVRNIRGEMKIPATEKTDIFIIGSDKIHLNLIKENTVVLEALLKISDLQFVEKAPDTFGATAPIENLSIFVPIPTKLLEQEKARLLKEQIRLEANLEKVKDTLKNPQFTERAPKELVDSKKALLERTTSELAEISTKLKKLA